MGIKDQVRAQPQGDPGPAEGFLPRHASAADSADRDAPSVIAPPPLIYLAGLGIGFGLDALLPSGSLPEWLAGSLGSVLLLAGVVLAASFVRAFRRAGTHINPGEPATTLVTTGPYRLSRNPGYLGMALGYAGIAILGGAPWALTLLLPTVFTVDRGVIRREERDLERRFRRRVPALQDPDEALDLARPRLGRGRWFESDLGLAPVVGWRLGSH
jgi:protein-S-isoprenylcysteine O-methyltransferase Ste14